MNENYKYNLLCEDYFCRQRKIIVIVKGTRVPNITSLGSQQNLHGFSSPFGLCWALYYFYLYFSKVLFIFYSFLNYTLKRIGYLIRIIMQCQLL
jgi:hypothetical protein